MAKNSVCFGAKDALERDLRAGLVPHSPIVLTSDQEDYLLNRKVWNSGYKLWKLKSSQPHLFANIERLREAKEAVVGCQEPPQGGAGAAGFSVVSPGWLFHPGRQVYMEEASQRCFVLDAAGNYREVAAGEDITEELSLTGAATASSCSSASSSKSSPSAGASATSARHLVIMDLHKAADIFKLDFAHVDRPAAMLAVYKHVEGGVSPEVAARCLHERLLRRLAAARASWSDAALRALAEEAVASLGAEQKAPAGVAGAVALVLGPRLVAVASHGAHVVIADALPGDMKDVRVAVASDAGAPELRAASMRLEARNAACVLLHTEGIDEQTARRAAGHAERGRPRAGAVALVRPAQAEVRAAGGDAALQSRAAACAHLSWSAAEEAAGDGGPASKRPRTADPKAKEKEQVRCRQVLLKYAGCRQPVDNVRRRPVQRSQAEAEAAILGVLEALDEAQASGGTAAVEAAFTKQVRAVSEHTSSLKGGDLAGDIGWLRLPESKPGEKISKEVAQRMLVIRAALSLAVNDVSDIVVSDEGVHLLKRAA